MVRKNFEEKKISKLYREVFVRAAGDG
uniref:Uncharacterized protein n=1 Tax=Nelumbo nucifera TaxID=4432 RepID=A0A822ZRR7_NELNU|nr:TPA_asm: hypothetical protein HUJ06_002758 [Nelumbo nucifera]